MDNYEQMLATLNHELAQTKERLRRQAEYSLSAVKENEDLREQLLSKTKELEQLNAQKSEMAANSPDSEVTDLRNRAHHLSLENEKLFQQVTVLRQYYDRFNQE